MNINEIKELLLTIDKTNLGYVKLQIENLNLEVSKNKVTNHFSESISNTKTIENIDVDMNPKLEIISEDLHIIKAPLMGTFYKSSSPNSEPFIRVGDKIDKNTTLCIVEAMKLMNEITSDVCGEVVEVLVDNEDLVEYNQPLFKIKLI